MRFYFAYVNPQYAIFFHRERFLNDNCLFSITCNSFPVHKKFTYCAYSQAYGIFYWHVLLSFYLLALPIICASCHHPEKLGMANIVLCCMVYVHGHCLYGVAYFVHPTEHISSRLIFTPLISHIKTVTDTITVITSYEYASKSLKYNSFYASYWLISGDFGVNASLSLHINGVGQEPPPVPYVIYTYKYTDQVN